MSDRSSDAGLGSVDTEAAAAYAHALGVAGADVELTLPRGAALGRYVVLDRVGAGGMGEVYAAYDPELDRKVALKLLRSGLARGEGGAARLLREAQAMAQLSHPNVITVHDVGTVAGRVFVAMEFIDGMTLRQWVRERSPSRREIVAVFERAGRGLEAAHAVGIVHRDFKPDNVLLGNDGRVRVADFGLARPVTDEPTPFPAHAETPGRRLLATPLTQEGAVLGTPAYMAPEQSRGERSDARSDQYAFCVALHEALYGELPDRDRASRRDAARVPAWLRRIVLRGLADDPNRRYPSMGALLRDLGHDPRARTRRWAIAAASCALAAAAVVVYDQVQEKRSLVCRGAERKLAGVWDTSTRASVGAAFTATRKPYAASAFREALRVLDGYTGAWTAMHTDACEATRRRGEASEEVLDLRMRCLHARLGEVRALGRVFAAADADVALHAVRAVHALTPLRACSDIEALTARVRPPADPAVRARVDALRARLAEAKALYDAGKYGEALPRATDIAADAGLLHYRPLQAEAQNLLGELQEKTGAIEPAIASLHAAARAAEAGRDHREAARAWTRLLYVIGVRQRQHAPAQAWAGYAAAAIEAQGGDEALEGALENHRGTLAAMEGQSAEAERLHRRALALREKALGAGHPEVGHSHSNLGIVLRRLGRDEALVHLRKAVEIARATLGAEHPDVAHSLNNLGSYHLERGDLGEAARCYDEALRIKERAFHAEHPDVATALNNVGLAREAKADYASALAAHARALAVRRKVFGDAHPDVALSLNNLGVVLEAQGHHARALQRFLEAMQIHEKTQRVDHPLVADNLENQGKALLGLGRHRDALQRFEHALRLLEKTAGSDRADVANALTGIGESRLGLGDAWGALAPLRRALSLLEKAKRAPNELADTRFALARALVSAPGGDEAAARRLALEARTAFAAAGSRYETERSRVDAWLAKRPPKR